MDDICLLKINVWSSMGYKKYERNIPVCLECGDKIRYGRTDKKFCCDECRSRHNNMQAQKGRTFRRRMLSILSKNYEILDSLIKSDVDSIDLMDLMAQGFISSVVTSYRKCGSHNEFSCFDIKFIMTSTRVYSISKIQNFD